MERIKKIQELQQKIINFQNEIEKLELQICEEKVLDFMEKNNLKEGQHFLLNEKECVGIYCDSYNYYTHPIKKDGNVSKIKKYIYSWFKINPL